MPHQKKAFSKKNFLSALKNIQKKLKQMSNASSKPSISIALISEAQKNLTTKKSFFEKMFRLLSERLRCRIRPEIIKKCRLSSLSPPISNIFIWRIDDLYCGILADEPRFRENLGIRWANNFVRLVMFQSEKPLLMNEHDHFCELSRILFTNEFKTVTERAAKFDQYIDQEIASLKQNHAAFLQSLKKWAVKRVVWKYATVLNWYTSNTKNYLWSLEAKKTYNLLDEWRPVVTKGQAHFRKPLPAIDELFESIDRFFSSQRQLRSFEYPLNENKDLHMLKGQFAQMSVYPRRPTEKDKETSTPKPDPPQKFFRIDPSSQSVFEPTTSRESPRTDPNFASSTPVSGVRFVPHQVAPLPDPRIRPKHDVPFSGTDRSSINIDSHSLASSSQKLISSFNQSAPDSEIDAQLTQKYLSNRRRRPIRQNTHSSPFYSPPSADFTFDLRTANNVLDMKLNATNFNLNPNDSDDVVKMIQTHLRPPSITIDLSQSPSRPLTQTVPTKRTQGGSSDSDDPKRARFEKKDISFTDSERPAKLIEWEFIPYTEPPKAGYSSYSERSKEKDKFKKQWKIKKTRRRVHFVSFRTFVRDSPLWACVSLPLAPLGHCI